MSAVTVRNTLVIHHEPRNMPAACARPPISMEWCRRCLRHVEVETVRGEERFVSHADGAGQLHCWASEKPVALHRVVHRAH